MNTSAKFILSKSKMLEQFNLIKQYVDEVSYSFKTNPIVGKLLGQETTCLLSIHTSSSLKEINNKSRILFFLQATDEEELKFLLEKGITRFVVDNRSDYNAVIQFINKQSKQIQLFLRMKLKEHTIHTGKHFVFGLSTEEVNAMIAEQANNPLILSLGIHFHRKTQNSSEWDLQEELQQSLTQQTLQTIDWLNIGGGIPIEYQNIHANSQPILEKINRLRKWLNTYNISLMAEPGRFIAGPCIKLRTTIKAIYANNIIVDASVYNAAMDTFIANVRLKVKEEVQQDQGKPYTIKGITPDSMDIFRYQVFLKNPQVGQALTFLNAGAYNFKADFCELPELPTEIQEE